MVQLSNRIIARKPVDAQAQRMGCIVVTLVFAGLITLGLAPLIVLIVWLVKKRRKTIRIKAKIKKDPHTGLLIPIKVEFDKTKCSMTTLIEDVLKTDLFEVDEMDGWKFQEYCEKLLESNGCSVLERPPKSGDMGVDIVVDKEGRRCAVQCKRSQSPIGQPAVREVVAGKPIYNCSEAMVITNNYFTDSAEGLAEANQTGLLDRDSIKEMLRKTHDIAVSVESFERKLHDNINAKWSEWLQEFKRLENLLNQIKELQIEIKNKKQRGSEVLKRGTQKADLKAFNREVKNCKRMLDVLAKENIVRIEQLKQKLELELKIFCRSQIVELERYCNKNIQLLLRQPECLEKKIEKTCQGPENCIKGQQGEIKEIVKKLEDWKGHVSSLTQKYSLMSEIEVSKPKPVTTSHNLPMSDVKAENNSMLKVGVGKLVKVILFDWFFIFIFAGLGNLLYLWRDNHYRKRAAIAFGLSFTAWLLGWIAIAYKPLIAAFIFAPFLSFAMTIWMTIDAIKAYKSYKRKEAALA